MNTVIQVVIAIVLILITITGIYTVTDATFDSAGDEVDDSSGLITGCLSGGSESDSCQLFSSNEDDGGG